MLNDLIQTYISSIRVVSPPAVVLRTAFRIPFASPFTLYLNLMHVPVASNVGETISALNVGFLGLLASKNRKYPRKNKEETKINRVRGPSYTLLRAINKVGAIFETPYISAHFRPMEHIRLQTVNAAYSVGNRSTE